MKHLRLLSFLTIICFCHSIYAANHFTVSNTNRPLLRTSIETSYSKTKEIKIGTGTPISAFCLTGNITKQSNDYLVRVLLKDKSDHYYCVLESYNVINDDNHISFVDYCEETGILSNIVPESLKIIIKDAVLTINSIGILNENAEQKENDIKAELTSRKEKQVDDIVQRINTYNNAHNRLWCAGVTPLALMNYEKKVRILGLNDDDYSEGIEYYIGGIFESGVPASPTYTNRTSAYVEKFDWRNRHGQNWMTSVKFQGYSGFCYSFCAIGAIEAMANLYYNRLLNLDLSEDEGARCPYSYDTYYDGGLASTVLEYAKNYGICDESSYGFVDSCCIPCKRDIVVPNEIVKIENYTYVGNSSEEAIKRALINNGPMTSGYKGHAMVLVGYATIKEGDVISIHTGTNVTYNVTINSGDPRIGNTYWIFKNSYGTSVYGNVNGYWYIMFNNLYYMREPYYITRPYCTINTSNNVVVCSDNDGDGYYFWGLGPKPANCPSWVPDEPDGDDSNSNYGPMDIYGNLEQNPCVMTINTTTSYSGNQSLTCWLGILDGGVLTISGTTTLSGNAKIKVCEGGTLIVDGGTVQDANLVLAPGSTTILRNGGVINMAAGNTFKAPIGAIVNIESGEIN